MAKRDPQIEQLGEVLDKSLKRLDPSGRLDDYGVWPIWNETVGPTIARNAQPEKIRNGILFVKVTSPVWMHELQYMKEMIADKLNQKLRAKTVENIFFVVGRVEEDKHKVEVKPQAPISPPSSDPKLEDNALERVHDPEIRRAIKRLFESYARRRPSQRG
jgi:predicted nucleic acid-binding Zn ribbon protein